MNKNRKIGAVFMIIGIGLMIATMMATGGYPFESPGEVQNNRMLLAQIIGTGIGGISIVIGLIISRDKR